jgi:serine/threonine protein kinase
MTTVDRLTTALADRYTIERELGAGGMATVYLAQDLKHDRQVASKVTSLSVLPSACHAQGCWAPIGHWQCPVTRNGHRITVAVVVVPSSLIS